MNVRGNSRDTHPSALGAIWSWTRGSQGRLALMGIAIIAMLTSVTLSLGLIAVPAPATISPPTAPVDSGRSHRAPFSMVAENQRPGTRAWAISPGADREFLQAYLGTVSTVPGRDVALYVSARQPADYTVEIFRLGWYGGAGARLMSRRGGLTSLAQGTWTPRAGLIGCSTCRLDPRTHLLEANWTHPVTLAIGADWPGGVYWIKLTATRFQAESAVMLVVRAARERAPVVASLPVNTYQAYNLWGGYSLYGVANPLGAAIAFDQRATRVSFNRPLPLNHLAGSSDFLNWDLHAIRWLERAGINVDYTTDVDVHLRPQRLMRHRVALVLGHSEYWTKTMYDAALAARDAGVSLGFIGANDIYWQARLEPDSQGTAARTLTCYKVETGVHDPTRRLDADPLARSRPDLLTTQWRDPALGRPENGLIGIMYRSYFASRLHPDWVVAPGPLDALMTGAGLRVGAHVAGGLVGYEFDSLFANGATPPGIVRIALSPVISIYGRHEIAATTYYRAASGALVFAAGTIQWSWGLDEASFVGANAPNPVRGNAAISRLMAGVVRAMDPALDFTTPQIGV